MIEKFQKQVEWGSWLLVIVLGLSALWLLQNIGRQSEASSASDTITVSGTGSVLAAPDVAVAELAISEERFTAKAAQDEASRKSKLVIDYLRNQGIDEKDIKTSGYNIYPQYDYFEGRSSIRGYQVTQSLTVKIRNLDKANEVLDGVVSAGVNQVYNFRFAIDDPEELRNEARDKAIDDARDQAKKLSDQLDVKLGNIVGFSEQTSGFPVPLYGDAAIGRGGGGGGPELPAGENEVAVSVSITYQIR